MEPRHGVMGTGLIVKHDGCARARLQPEAALLAPLAHECAPLARSGLELVRRCDVADPPTDQLLGFVAKDGRHATRGANVCLILVDDQHELPRLGPQRGVLKGDEPRTGATMVLAGPRRPVCEANQLARASRNPMVTKASATSP